MPHLSYRFDRSTKFPVLTSTTASGQSVAGLLEHPESVAGLRFTYEPEEPRFFQARLGPVA